MATKPPKFSIDDTIYLRESAMLGFIESYKITGMHYETSSGQWIYHIAIKPRRESFTTVMDMYQLVNKEELLLREDELVTFCEAVNLAIIETQRRLNQLLTMKSEKCQEL